MVIKYIKDNEGNNFFPVVNEKGVVDDNGTTLESKLQSKQDAISDLSTIRSGASAGATAVQSVTVGTTTTGAAGSSASVTNTGTATAPVLSFTIPQGAQGIQGIQGPQGERGPQGNTGVQVDSVASIIHSIDPTATYAAADVAGADAVQDVLSEVTELGGKLALGAVYDVSAENPTAGPNSDGKWETLSTLLSDANLNTLIPTALRKGGMSIKFIQSSDNKYVQYRLTSQQFTTNTTQWQDIDFSLEESYKNIIIDLWQPNTLFKVGQEVLIDNIYYRCILEHTSDDVFEISDKWAIIDDFIVKGPYIQTSNDTPIVQTNIMLTGFDTYGPSAGALNIGDIYYHTGRHQLRVAITTSPTYASLPFYKGAIYTCNNKLYTWNGSDLIECNSSIQTTVEGIQTTVEGIQTDVEGIQTDVEGIQEFGEDYITPERTKLQAYCDFYDPTSIKASISGSRTFYFVCKPNETYEFTTIDGYRLVIGYTKTTPQIGTVVYGTIGNQFTPGQSKTLTITTDSEAKYLICFYYSTTGSIYSEQEIFDSFLIKGPSITAKDTVARKDIKSIQDELSHYIYDDNLPINAINYHNQWNNLVNANVVRRSTATYFSWDTEELYPMYVYRIQTNSDWMDSGYRAEQNLDGTNPLYKRKKIMITSGVHGNERVTPNALYKIIEKTMKDSNYNSIFGEFDFVIIPLCNPYGYSNTLYTDNDEPIIDNNSYPLPQGYHIEQNTESVNMGLRRNINHLDINRDFSDVGGFITEEARFIRDIFIEETPDLCIDFHQDWNDHSSKAVGFVSPGNSSVKTQEEIEEIKRQVYKRIDKAGVKTDSFINKYFNLTDKQLTYCWQMNTAATIKNYFSGYANGTSGNTLHQDIAVDYSFTVETDVFGYKIGGSGRWNSRVKAYTYEFIKNFIQSILSVF